MRTSRSLLAVVAGTLFLSACGGIASEGEPAPDVSPSSSAEPGSAEPGDFPVEVAGATIEQRPVAIVSLSASATEILFAIEAGDQVIAVDSTSNFPEDAPLTELSAFQPNVEAIAAYDPDLVITSFDPGDLVSGLNALGIPVIVQGTAASIDDTYAQIEQLGAATGNLAEAAGLVADLTTRIADIVEALPTREVPLTYYYELDPTYFTVTDDTFLGQLFSAIGLTSVAVDPDGASFGYPQMNAEAIVEANPDVILLADTKCCQITASAVAERPGWSEIRAVVDGNVVELDDDIASRWGPRIVELLELVAERIAAIEPANA